MEMDNEIQCFWAGAMSLLTLSSLYTFMLHTIPQCFRNQYNVRTVYLSHEAYFCT